MITFRTATEKDVPLIHRFIRSLAEYEKLAHEVKATQADLQKTLFGPKAYAEVVFSCWNGKEEGFALFFHNYSTFLGKPGIYLEDLYVTPEMRGRGLGKALLSYLAKLAIERECGRLEWWVLDWNQSSIDFYKKLRARPMDEWTVFRLDGEDLKRLATGN